MEFIDSMIEMTLSQDFILQGDFEEVIWFKSLWCKYQLCLVLLFLQLIGVFENDQEVI